MPKSTEFGSNAQSLSRESRYFKPALLGRVWILNQMHELGMIDLQGSNNPIRQANLQEMIDVYRQQEPKARTLTEQPRSHKTSATVEATQE